MTTNDNNRRRRYEKPTVRVYELHSRTHLLQASATGTNSSMNVIYEEEDI